MQKIALAALAVASILVCASLWAFQLIDLRIGLGIGMVPLVLGPAAMLVLVWAIWLIASLVSRRWRLALVVLAIPIASAMLFFLVDRAGMTAFEAYFLSQHTHYRAEVSTATRDGVAPLLAWDWGDTGSAGVGPFIYTLVYDTSGTIARPRSAWPSDWRAKAKQAPGHLFPRLLDPRSSGDPSRPMLVVEPLGESFYLVEELY